MAEWLKAHAWKACLGETLTWVRIPLSPPDYWAATSVGSQIPAQAKLGRATRLDCLKAAAKRAGVNPDEFWLHKFRATFATWHLWSGVDLRTVQQWLGHSDMESTMRYLKPSRSEATAAKVNETFA